MFWKLTFSKVKEDNLRKMTSWKIRIFVRKCKKNGKKIKKNKSIKEIVVIFKMWKHILGHLEHFVESLLWMLMKVLGFLILKRRLDYSQVKSWTAFHSTSLWVGEIVCCVPARQWSDGGSCGSEKLQRGRCWVPRLQRDKHVERIQTKKRRAAEIL